MYILLIIAALIAAFYFFQSDEKYIKKTTVKLLKLAVSPATPLSTTAMLNKTNTIAKHIHFSVQYEVNINDHVYQDRSLADLRSSMLVYFRQPNNWQVDIPVKQEINVKIDSSEGNKTAEAFFNIKIEKENKKASCNALLHWIKEKKWLINQIKVFSCSPIH